MKINNQAIKKLKNSNNVGIFVHINPDGDCLGAASALKQALVSLNKQVDIFCDFPIDDRYNYVKYINEINNKTCMSYDLLIAVDCADRKRMGKYSTMFMEHENTIIFDHHKTDDDFAAITVKEIVSSTCLILYYYIKALGVEINADIANALYMGIATDTGSFQHSNTTFEEHIVAAELIKTGFNLFEANERLFKYCSRSRFELLKLALASSKFFYNGQLGIITITQNDLKQTKASISDTTGIVDYITNINGIQVGVNIYETQHGLFKVSFRSRGVVDVNKIAESFGGGGHKFASGCNIYGNASTVIKKVVEACKNDLKD